MVLHPESEGAGSGSGPNSSPATGLVHTFPTLASLANSTVYSVPTLAIVQSAKQSIPAIMFPAASRPLCPHPIDDTFEHMLKTPPNPAQQYGLRELFASKAVDPLRSYVLSAPTGTGKTLLALFFIEMNSHGVKTDLDMFSRVQELIAKKENDIFLFVAPTKALVGQHAEEIKRRLPKKLVTSYTSDDCFSNRLWENVDILVITPEMLNSVISQNSVCRRVKGVVLDEFHVTGDSASYELAIALALSKLSAPFFIMTATLHPKNIDVICARVQRGGPAVRVCQVPGEYRMTPLAVAIFDASQDFLVAFKSIPQDVNAPEKKIICSLWAVFSNLKNYISSKNKVILFVDSRNQCDLVRNMLLSNLEGPPQVLKRKIAIHNAGLSKQQRKYVEDEFTSPNGDIDIIVGTNTLAIGCNFPCDVVIILGTQSYKESTIHIPDDLRMRPALGRTEPFGVANPPKKTSEILQMVGRAGRYKMGLNSFGAAWVVSSKICNQENLMAGSEFFSSPFHRTDGIFTKLDRAFLTCEAFLALLKEFPKEMSIPSTGEEFMQKVFGLAEILPFATIADYLQGTRLIEKVKYQPPEQERLCGVTKRDRKGHNVYKITHIGKYFLCHHVPFKLYYNSCMSSITSDEHTFDIREVSYVLMKSANIKATQSLCHIYGVIFRTGVREHHMVSEMVADIGIGIAEEVDHPDPDRRYMARAYFKTMQHSLQFVITLIDYEIANRKKNAMDTTEIIEAKAKLLNTFPRIHLRQKFTNMQDVISRLAPVSKKLLSVVPKLAEMFLSGKTLLHELANKDGKFNSEMASSEPHVKFAKADVCSCTEDQRAALGTLFGSIEECVRQEARKRAAAAAATEQSV